MGTPTTVLLVEDDLVTLRMLKLNLSARGFDVVDATYGSEALEKFEESEVDLAVIDLVLPDMNGVDLCCHIRSSSQVPVVLMSADREWLEWAKRSTVKAQAYLNKPFGIACFVETVRQLAVDGRDGY